MLNVTEIKRKNLLCRDVEDYNYKGKAYLKSEKQMQRCWGFNVHNA